jgi:hypothetical protein
MMYPCGCTKSLPHLPIALEAGVGYQLFAGFGGGWTGSAAVDGAGNVALFSSPGWGGWTSAGGGAAFSGTIFKAKSVGDLADWFGYVGGSVVGVEVGPLAGVEVPFGKGQDGSRVVGLSVLGGAGAEPPFSGELHARADKARLVKKANLFHLLERLDPTEAIRLVTACMR